MLWVVRSLLACQLAPQFRDMVIHPVDEPLICTALMDPGPATLKMSTSLKYLLPLMVNRTPPLLEHDTLQRGPAVIKQYACTMSVVISRPSKRRAASS
jgi:hypothetical protein